MQWLVPTVTHSLGLHIIFKINLINEIRSSFGAAVVLPRMACKTRTEDIEWTVKGIN